MNTYAKTYSDTYPGAMLRLLGKTGIYFTGQAGFIFKSKNGTKLGVDLYLSDCVEREHGFKRLSPKVVRAGELDLDYVAATHRHLDHFDIDAIAILMENGKTKLCAAADCREHVKKLNLDMGRTTFIREGDSVQCGDMKIDAVFCDHGKEAPLAVGLVIEWDGYKVYIAGDTALRLDKADKIAAYGPFDLLIAPINGAYGNMNETEAVQLCGYYKPKLMIPCHFWTFAEHHGDPGIFMEQMEKELPGQAYLIMAAGETAELG